MVREGPGGTVVEVRVIPRASRSALAGERDGALLVRLAAPPVDGRANAALLAFLADALGVADAPCSIVHGDTARQKRVLVTGLAPTTSPPAGEPAMTRADFLIDDADLVATCARAGPTRRRGAGRHRAPCAHASVAAWQGRIVAVGPADDVARAITLDPDATVDRRPRTCTVVPGFVDSHTHAVFAGDRRDELRAPAGRRHLRRDRRRGRRHRAHGRRDTRAASEDELVTSALPRLAEALAQGTTTCEVKSGYGLDTATELRMLRAIRALAARAADRRRRPRSWARTRCRSSIRGRRDDYVRLVIDEMLPAVAREGLAEWNDVFCEARRLHARASRARILEAGARARPAAAHPRRRTRR